MSKYYIRRKTVKAHSQTYYVQDGNGGYKPVRKRKSSYTRDQRYRQYDPILREKALEQFEKRSEHAKAIDRSKTSKKVFDKPNEYWLKYMGKSDVKGIDTMKKSTSKYANMSIEELQNQQHLKNSKIIDLENKMRKAKRDSKEYKKLSSERQNLVEEVDEISINIYNIEYLRGEDIRDILKKGEIGKISYLAEKDIPQSVSTEYHRIKALKLKIGDQLEDLSKLDVEIQNLKDWKESKEKILEKKKAKKIIKNEMKESFEKLYAYVPKALEQHKEFEKNYKLLNKHRKKFFEKHEEVPILDLGKGYTRDYYEGKLCCMDSPRISMLMTQDSYKQVEALYNATKKGKKVSLNEADLILNNYGDLIYRFGTIEFSKERIDRALKGFGEGKSEILFTEDAPIIIKNKDLVFASVPRSVESDYPTLDYSNPEKQPLYGHESIKISFEDFNKILKNNTKKDLMMKANLPETYKKYDKNRLIYHYIISTKTY